jgi:hypothetical protein
MYIRLYVLLSHWGCTNLVKTMFLYHIFTYRSYIQIHTDTYNINIYVQIHAHTYTYIQPAISVERGFGAALAAAHDSPAQSHLSRSSQRGLRAGLPSAKCVWNAYWLRRGCTLDPPTRAARAGAPKRVRGWVSYGGKSGRPPAQGALSGTRGVPPQPGVFWGRCAGIRTCLGQYIQYIQILVRYTHDTYNT